MRSLRNGYHVLFSLIGLISSAQLETSNWFFGNGAGISFSNTTLTNISNGVLSTSLGCSSISDANGNLLFYTDGVTVWNQSHTVLSNGSGLTGTNSAQSSLIIKQPSNSHLYYLFTVQGGGGLAGLNYSIVDMTLSSSQGSVTIKNAPLYNSPCDEKLSAVRHCNGTDVWILVHERNSLNFRAYLLTGTGINTTAVISSGSIFHLTSNYLGTMKFSPNGKKLGLTYNEYNGLGHNAKIELYDFDNSTGILSNAQTYSGWTSNLPIQYHSYGTEFSPDGSKFYFTFATSILQFDCFNLQNPAGVWDLTLENQNSDTSLKGTLQLAPNGKIYVARLGQSNLGVINNPNLPGNSCGYSASGPSLGSYTCGYGLPIFLTSFFEQRNKQIVFKSNMGSGCNVVSFLSPTLCSASGYSISSIAWNFGDPLSGNNNTSSASAPTHTFSGTGNYTIQLILQYGCGQADTIVKVVPVTTPTITINNPSPVCTAATVSASIAGGTGSYTYTWSPGNQTTAVANSLATGIYTINFHDTGSGCTGSLTTPVVAVVLNAGTTITDPLCYGNLDGIITSTISGGLGNYTYSWNPGGASSSSLSNVGVGIYTLIVIDINSSCTLSKTISISQPPPVLINIANSASSVCVGNLVSFTASATGGSAPYNYQWLNGSSSSVSSFSSSNGGSTIHTVVAVDSKSCTASSTTAVQVINNPSLTASAVSVCPQQIAHFSASGASSYTWLPSNLVAPTLSVTALSNQIFTVSGEALGCISTLTTNLFLKPIPIFTLTANSPLCEGQNLFLMSNHSGSHTWAGPQGFVSSVSNPVIYATPVASGNYSAIVTAANSCTASSQISVLIKPAPVLTAISPSLICQGQSAVIMVTGASSILWDFGPSLPIITVQPSLTTAYSFTGTSSQNGCSSTGSATVIVLPSPTISIIGKNEICKGESVYLLATGALTYSWNTSANTPGIPVQPLNSTVYYVTGASQNFSCVGKAQIKIDVYDCLSTEESKSDNDLSVFPNPSTGTFFLKCPGPLSIDIRDAIGRKLQSEKLNAGIQSFNLHSPPAGIYFLFYVSDQTSGIIKLIKAN